MSGLYSSSEEGEMKAQIGFRDWVMFRAIVLGTLCALMTGAILFSYVFTKPTIVLRQAEDTMATLEQVLSSDLYTNQPLDDITEILDSEFASEPVPVYIARHQDTIAGVVFEAQSEGYGGTIRLLIGINSQGEILGVRTLSHKETPGLADNIEIGKSPWMKDFDGRSFANTPMSDWAVQKDGGVFDQFTGATITPRAVVNGVVAALHFYQRNRSTLLEFNQSPEDATSAEAQTPDNPMAVKAD